MSAVLRLEEKLELLQLRRESALLGPSPENDNAIQSPLASSENSHRENFPSPHLSLLEDKSAPQANVAEKPKGLGQRASGVGITGKEEDVEVGLQYFGKRFLNPLLGRWVSADPLAVHAPGSADLNLYAYVHGTVLKAVDPLGLCDGTNCTPAQSGGSSEAPAAKAQFSITIRRFAPFSTFGGGFHGDAESRGVTTEGVGGHSTDPDVSSRISTLVKVDGEKVSQARSFSDPSAHPVLGEAVGTPETSSVASRTSATGGHIDVQSAGSMPLTTTNTVQATCLGAGTCVAPVRSRTGGLIPSPIPFAPDIDTDVSLDYSQNGNILALNGTAWGDDFPNAEIYVTDSAGNSVMLGTFQTDSGWYGPGTSLIGAGEREGEDQIMTFGADIPLDPSGNFAASVVPQSSEGPVE